MPRYELTLGIRGAVKVQVEAPDVGKAEEAVVRERRAAELLGDPGAYAEVYVEHVKTLEEPAPSGGRH